MSIIRWKFKSLKNEPYNNVQFSGIDISVSDLCDLIMKAKNMKPGESKLQIFDASTGEEYKDYSDMIPRNKSVYVVKVPVKTVSGPLESKTVEALANKDTGLTAEDLIGTKDVGVAAAVVTEEDKLRAMIEDETDKNQQARLHSKPKWPNKRTFQQKPPPEYTCHSCGGKDHYRQQCLKGKGPRALGIPSSLLVGVSRHAPGVMKDSEGKFVVPKVDLPALLSSKGDKSGESEVNEVKVPPDIVCGLCGGVMKDAVIITCCQESFCDECIRNHLLENDFQCPECFATMSPDKLVINKFLRKNVQKFHSEIPTGAKLVFPKKEPVEHGNEGTPDALMDDDSSHSMPSRSEETTKTTGEPSGKESPIIDDSRTSSQRSPQPAPTTTIKEGGGSKGSSPLRISQQDLPTAPVLPNIQNMLIPHPLAQSTPPVPAFPSVPQQFRLPASFNLGGGLVPQPQGFATAVVPPAVGTMLPGSQFTAPIIPIVQPPVPAPPPTTTTSLGSKVPLSKEEFLRLQKAARKTERLKRKKDSSKSRSSKRRRRSDSLSSEDSLSPPPSRGSSRTHSPRRSPVARSKSDPKRRKHEHKRSKTSDRISAKSSSSRHKKTSKKRSGSPSAEAASSSKRHKSQYLKPSSPGSGTLSPIPEPETELVSSSTNGSHSHSLSPSLTPSPSHSPTEGTRGGPDPDMDRTTEDKPEVEAGEQGDQSIRDDDEVDGVPHELDNDDEGQSVDLNPEVADEFANEALEEPVEGVLEEGEVSDSEEPTWQEVNKEPEDAPVEMVSEIQPKEPQSDSPDSGTSSEDEVSNVTNDSSDSESDTERLRRSKRRDKVTSSHRDRMRKSRRREESRERRRHKERREKKSSRRTREKERARETSRRHKDVKKRRKARYSSEERSSRHKHKSKHSRKSKHRKH